MINQKNSSVIQILSRPSTIAILPSTSHASMIASMSLPLVFHPDFVCELPAGHRFPMPKFGKLYEHLIRNGIATLDQFNFPKRASRELLQLAHTPSYVDSYCDGTIDERAMRRI